MVDGRGMKTWQCFPAACELAMKVADKSLSMDVSLKIYYNRRNASVLCGLSQGQREEHGHIQEKKKSSP